MKPVTGPMGKMGHWTDKHLFGCSRTIKLRTQNCPNFFFSERYRRGLTTHFLPSKNWSWISNLVPCRFDWTTCRVFLGKPFPFASNGPTSSAAASDRNGSCVWPPSGSSAALKKGGFGGGFAVEVLEAAWQIWGFPKIGKHPKMDGENNGKPY